jgi:hypothetical protein
MVRCSRRAKALSTVVLSLLLLVLGPAEQLAPETQGFFPQLELSSKNIPPIHREIARTRNGALQGVDQLGHGGEDWAVVVGQLAGSGLCEAGA